MFGIGFPEMVVIAVVALIVVGPEKLPELARTAAKTITELKRSAEALKVTIKEESGVSDIIDEIRPELETTAKELQGELHDLPHDISSLLKKQEASIPKESEELTSKNKDLAENNVKNTAGIITTQNTTKSLATKQDDANTQS